MPLLPAQPFEPTESEKLPTGGASGVVVPPQAAPAPTVVVVGGGMVGQRCCEEIRARPGLQGHRVVLFGDEGSIAYDRVHLGEVLAGGSVEQLRLVRSSWYEEHRVELSLADPVVAIDRAAQRVVCESGREQRYDHLIIATGAAPVLGNIPGAAGRDVQVLRSAEDAKHLRHLAQQAKEADLPAVIIGGGLLGLEVADELLRLGLSVTTLESARYPLSRQLDESAGELLAHLLNQRQFDIRASARVLAVKELELGSLVELEGSEPVHCGLVVPAMGIRPRDALAREAGLACDLFGGIVVDDALLTSDPNISAIGECARHRGMCHGLVAPGYAMAEVAVQRLNGETVRFEGAQIGTRLKVKGLDLTVVGESTATGLGTLSHTYEQEGQYRRLVLRKGRVIGITALGTWNDLGRAQEAMAKGEKLRPLQLKRFEQDEAMWKQKRLSLRTWPDSATVCTCMGVTCGTLKRAYDEGAVSTEALAQKTGASTVCGSCKPLLATLAEEEPEAQRRSPWMVRFSVASALGAILFLLAPRVPLSPSVMTRGIDILYTDALAKQITGFTVLGFFSASILFSMRKRLSWFAWKEFESWRVAHAFLGVLCLVGAFFHTGFRLGTRLDLALMMTVLASCFLGGLAGGWELVEERLEPHQATALRAWLVRSHIYLLWPLPLLLLVHILKVYFF